MTRTFRVHFANGVLVPLEEVELPIDRELTVTVDAPDGEMGSSAIPRFDDPADPMPAGGATLMDWIARHRLPVPRGVGDRIARSREFDPHGELEDDT